MNGCILITIDALRYDHVIPSGNDDPPTPYLHSLAEDGILFENHFSTGPGTSSSFPGIHASALPLDDGYAGLNSDHTSLAEELRNCSVQTLGVTANTSCSSLFEYDRGFDNFKDWITEDGLDDNTSADLFSGIKSRLFESVKEVPILHPFGRKILDYGRDLYGWPCPYHRASEVTDKSLYLIRRNINKRQPYFIWIHYMEPHSPYHSPKEYVERFHNGNFTQQEVNGVLNKLSRFKTKENRRSLRDLISDREVNAIKDMYRAASASVDDEIQRLVNELEGSGYLEDVPVIISSDHGEELFDHGDFGHPPKLYDELVHVPLIYYNASADNNPKKIQSITSHLDLAPTIAELLGVPRSEEWRGTSLGHYIESTGRENQRDQCLMELCHSSGLGGSIQPENYVGAVRTSDWKYILDRQTEEKHLYNIEEDPKETRNVLDEREGIADELAQVLSERIQSIEETQESVELSDEAEQRLRQLGYRE